VLSLQLQRGIGLATRTPNFAIAMRYHDLFFIFIFAISPEWEEQSVGVAEAAPNQWAVSNENLRFRT